MSRVVAARHFKSGLGVMSGGYFTSICASLIPSYIHPHILLKIVGTSLIRSRGIKGICKVQRNTCNPLKVKSSGLFWKQSLVFPINIADVHEIEPHVCILISLSKEYGTSKSHFHLFIRSLDAEQGHS